MFGFGFEFWFGFGFGFEFGSEGKGGGGSSSSSGSGGSGFPGFRFHGFRLSLRGVRDRVLFLFGGGRVGSAQWRGGGPSGFKFGLGFEFGFGFGGLVWQGGGLSSASGLC